MTVEQVRKIIREENPIYNTLAEVPEYWRNEIKAMMDEGIIQGTGNGKLGLTRSEAKSAVMVWRGMQKK